MPLGEEGQVGERIDLLLDLDLYIIIARTCVGKRCCITCITCIICVRIAGAAWRLQAYARQFGQVEGRTEVSCGLPFSRRWRKAVRPSPG